MEKEESARGTSDKNSSGGDVSDLKQLVTSLEQAGEKLEKYYRSEDAENLNKTKKFILQIQTKIAEILQ